MAREGDPQLGRPAHRAVAVLAVHQPVLAERLRLPAADGGLQRIEESRCRPWIGFAIAAVVLQPGFAGLGDAATPTNMFGSTVDVVQIFGLPLTIHNYSSQVFLPLLMARGSWAAVGPQAGHPR